MTKKEKMLARELYQAGDPELVAARLQARKLMKTFNDSDPEGIELRAPLVRKALQKSREEFLD